MMQDVLQMVHADAAHCLLLVRDVQTGGIAGRRGRWGGSAACMADAVSMYIRSRRFDRRVF